MGTENKGKHEHRPHLREGRVGGGYKLTEEIEMGIKLCMSAPRKEVRKELKDVQVGRNKRKSN